ncbi:hypothetical protein MTO96_008467 [Rhipicephalus appendiculatus]
MANSEEDSLLFPATARFRRSSTGPEVQGWSPPSTWSPPAGSMAPAPCGCLREHLRRHTRRRKLRDQQLRGRHRQFLCFISTEMVAVRRAQPSARRHRDRPSTPCQSPIEAPRHRSRCPCKALGVARAKHAISTTPPIPSAIDRARRSSSSSVPPRGAV